MIHISSFTPKAIILIMTGILSGFVDSIAGGGGLINLPILSLLLEPGPVAIGTNKIAGAVAAFVALLVFIRRGHMDTKKSIAFTGWIAIGSLCGSQVAPLLPTHVFKWLLAATCPIILWVVWKKDLWVKKELLAHSLHSPSKWSPLGTRSIILSGFGCGFYDGVWGPGGGTFMFLSLLFFAELPLLTALAAAKLANTCSASVALISYAAGGFVHWTEGALLALGITVGAFFGASHATQRASKIVRPVLAFVVVLLLIKVLLLN
jgi:uncharacterized membrane protein YfcA